MVVVPLYEAWVADLPEAAFLAGMMIDLLERRSKRIEVEEVEKSKMSLQVELLSSRDVVAGRRRGRRRRRERERERLALGGAWTAFL